MVKEPCHEKRTSQKTQRRRLPGPGEREGEAKILQTLPHRTTSLSGDLRHFPASGQNTCVFTAQKIWMARHFQDGIRIRGTQKQRAMPAGTITSHTPTSPRDTSTLMSRPASHLSTMAGLIAKARIIRSVQASRSASAASGSAPCPLSANEPRAR